MIELIIGIAMILTGCGDASDNKAATEEAVQTEKKAPDEKSEATREPGEVARSLAFKTANELPSCDDANNHVLAYIIDEKRFVTCQDSAWMEIDVKGEDGVDATAEEKANEWVDPTNGQVWMVTGYTTTANGTSQFGSTCDIAADWRAPTYEESVWALMRGIGIKSGSFLPLLYDSAPSGTNRQLACIHN